MNQKAIAIGSCNCGTVRFSISQPLTDIYVCHCSICRKATGSSGIAVTVVATNNVTFESGENNITHWQKPKHDWLINFCTTCGSPLPGKNDESTSYVPVSLLDESSHNLSIKHHIWVESKASWEIIGDTGKQHPQAFEADD